VSSSMKKAFALIIGLFILLFIGTYFLFKVAFSVYTPPVQKDYFERGLYYKDTLKKIAEAEEAGWTLSIPGSERGVLPQKGTLTVVLTSPKEELKTADVKVKIELPATQQGSQLLSMAPVDGKPGEFSVAYEVSMATKYEVYVSAAFNENKMLRKKIAVHFQ